MKKEASKPKAVKKAAKRKVELPKPKHPLMLNGQSWDRQKVMDILCERVASSSKSLVTLLKAGHDGYNLPSYVIISKWMADDPDLVNQYARAKEQQAEYMADEMMDIADEMPLTNPITGSLDSASVQHQRLRTDTRKWLMGKLKPKKYGDKVALDHSGNIGIEQLIAGAGDDASSD